jgi:hypothetical protein
LRLHAQTRLIRPSNKDNCWGGWKLPMMSRFKVPKGRALRRRLAIAGNVLSTAICRRTDLS